MLRAFLSIAICIAFLTPIRAQQTPTADAVLKTAYKLAAREHKNVIVIFHASWCGWCHKLDSAIQDPVCKQLFNDNYVITHLTVLESPGKKQLENAGAQELLTKYKGDKEGIPFFLIFDANGKFLADSKYRTAAKPEGSNMGCPATNDEVNAFLAVLKNTSNLKDDQLDIIAERFKKNSPTS
ncbi:Thioredoxin-like [bacterium A37T11]|nr:Thioredoxin-like [bacterium A37T11]